MLELTTFENVHCFNKIRTWKHQTGKQVSQLTFLNPFVFNTRVVIFILVNRRLKLLVWMLIALFVENIDLLVAILNTTLYMYILNSKIILNHLI